jgi:predicted RNA-binding Zn ribbon-like protein
MQTTELIRDFVNTRELLDGSEELAAPADVAAWLAGRGLLAPGVAASPTDLRRALELREALRCLLLANNGLDVPRGGAYGVLREAARRARVELAFGGSGSELVPAADGIDGGLGRILAAVHSAMADGSWQRLKACRASDCEWAFVDTARNHSRSWCSMASCGNREKARAFRERHR